MHGLILTGFMSNYELSSFRRTAGAHRIATHLRNQNWDIEVIDFITGWTLPQLKELSKSRISSDTKFIGFGGTFPIWNNTIEEYFKWVKSTFPNIVIIAGGQITNLYKIQADWYIDGFAENAIVKLLQYLFGNSTEKIKYQLFANGRKIIKGNLDYPSFPMKSLKITYELRDFILPQETLITELGRGCIFNCKFCNFPILGVKEDHTRDGEDFYEELQATYDNFGVTQYQLADETVNDYTEKLIKFKDAVKKLSFKPTLTGFARGDLFAARKQDWDIMIEMGFIAHHYGIESTNPKSVKMVGKGMNPDKLLSGLIEGRNYFKKFGPYKGQVSLIAGLPYETMESFSKTLNWFETNWKTENIILFPLYIPKVGSGDNMSLLSKEWTDYGYRTTKRDLYPVIHRIYNKYPTQYGVSDGHLENTGVSWENDEWNIAKVYEICGKYTTSESYEQIYGPVAWTLGEWQLALNKPYEFFVDKTMSEIKEGIPDISNFKSSNHFVISQHQTYINKYIDNKLNWSKS